MDGYMSCTVASLTSQGRELVAATAPAPQSPRHGRVVQELVDLATVLLVLVRLGLLVTGKDGMNSWVLNRSPIRRWKHSPMQSPLTPFPKCSLPSSLTCIQKKSLLDPALNLSTNTRPVVHWLTLLNSQSSGKMIRSWRVKPDRKSTRLNSSHL